MKTVDTYRGLRNVDVANKMVENNEGEMVSYVNIKPVVINGEQHFAYVHADGKNATALTLDGHKKANELSDTQKSANVTRQNVENLMNEGYQS